MWGLVLKEWNSVSGKTKTNIIAGIATIILSVFMVGYGNALKQR
jgi:L-rhamnose-H+ transport protein